MQIVCNVSRKNCHLIDEETEIHSSKQAVRSQRRRCFPFRMYMLMFAD